MSTRELSYIAGGRTLQLNRERCIGCGMCIEVCPHQVFQIEDHKAVIHDRQACMECGACMMNCPAAAILVDSGVGCAAALLKSSITGKEAVCGCSEEGPAEGKSSKGCCC